MNQIVNLLGTSSDLFFALDHDYRFIYISPMSGKEGTSHAALTGKRIWDEFLGEEGSRLQNECGVAHTERRSVRFDDFFEAAGKWVDVAIYPSDQGLSVYLHDITEKKAVERALRDSEDMFRRLLESASEAIVVVNGSGQIVLVNAKAEERFGYNRQELYGQSVEILLPVSLHHQHLAHREAYLEDPRSRPMGIGMDLSARRKDGTEFPVEVSLGHVKTGEGLLVMSFVTDITERKRRDEQLREQAALLDQTRDAVIVRNAIDTILYWNKGAELMYGWTSAEAVGADSKHLYSPVVGEHFEEAKAATLEHGEWSGEFGHVTKDGREILVETRWTSMKQGDKSSPLFLIINTDITAKRKLEDQFLRGQRMESIGTLAGGIAHDINNILSPILMSVQMLKMKFNDKDSQRMLSLLQENAQRGADLIRQVLEFARGAKGEKIPLQPRHAVKDLVKILNQTLPKGIEVSSSFDKEPWLINGDPTQISQVLMNLSLNARDAMPEGGHLKLGIDNVVVDEAYARMNLESRPGHFVMISVTDDGTGMPSGVVGRIFEPFFTTKDQGHGTGLGLSTVMGIVKGHGGFINVYSEVGNGTRFQVYFPVAEALVSREAPEEREDLPRGSGELILVVDDEAAIREITKGTLELFGYSVLTASDGTEAVALYAQHRDRIKVVLTDLMMPYMDGAATIRALRKINPELKVIGSSGLTSNGKEAELTKLGVNGFLIKPYSAERLLKSIAELIALK
jgi:two-component system cell cycle sensor histidine kinase/response regulator CckA